MSPVLSIGHRGARGHEPENTLLSIERGITLGADWIEIDVHLVSGRLVVIHDATLDRTTSGTGIVAAQSIGYLRSLDAGKGQSIPFLEEVFERINHRARLNIELKDGVSVPALAATINRYVADHVWQWNDLVVCSFLHSELVRIKQALPNILTGALVGGRPSDLATGAQRIGAWSINPESSHVDQTFVDDAHGRGIKMFPYTVNDPLEIGRLIDLGVDGIISDYPERVIAARR